MSPPDPADDAQAAVARARALLDLGRADDALEVATRAAVADPTDPVVELVVAECHLRLDDTEQAIRHAARAGSLAPDWPLPHVLRARALVSIGHRDEAERAARTAIALAPESALTHATLGVVLAWAERRPAEARASTDHAVELAPDDPEIRLDAARVALALRDWTSAEEHAQAALSIRPDDDSALDLLGAALSRQRRPAEALRHFSQSARLDPAGPGASLARAEAQRLGGPDWDVHRLLLVALAGLGVAWTFVAVPAGVRPALLVLLLLGGTVAAWTWRERRRSQYTELSEADRAVVDHLRGEPTAAYVLGLWTVFGVAVLFALLFGVQLIVPPADGEATATTTQSLVIVGIAVVVAGLCGRRLRQIRLAREE